MDFVPQFATEQELNTATPMLITTAQTLAPHDITCTRWQRS